MAKKNRSKWEPLRPDMKIVFLTAIMCGAVIFLFIGIILPMSQKKISKTRNDLVSFGQLADDYRKEHGAFPESVEELRAFAGGNSVAEKGAFPREDPWNREYRYFKVSDDRAAIVSGGSDRKIETNLDNLSAGSTGLAMERMMGIRFLYNPEEDDWIYLAGSWRTEEE